MHPLEEAALRVALTSVLLRIETVFYIMSMTVENKARIEQTITILRFEIVTYEKLLTLYPPTAPTPTAGP